MHTYAAMRKDALTVPTVAPAENDSTSEQPRKRAAAPKKVKTPAEDGPKRKPATGRKRKVGQKKEDDDEEYTVSKKVKSSTDKGRDEPDEPEVETDQAADEEENA